MLPLSETQAVKPSLRPGAEVDSAESEILANKRTAPFVVSNLTCHFQIATICVEGGCAVHNLVLLLFLLLLVLLLLPTITITNFPRSYCVHACMYVCADRPNASGWLNQRGWRWSRKVDALREKKLLLEIVL